jgi:hypothetical protein
MLFYSTKLKLEVLLLPFIFIFQPKPNYMSTPTETSQQEAIQQLYNYAAGLKSDGRSEDDIKADLVTQGVDEESAGIIAADIEVQFADLKNKAANKNMLYGGLWCIGGTIVTIATYSAAEGGGRYVVAWGAIIFGAIQFFKGVGQKA